MDLMATDTSPSIPRLRAVGNSKATLYPRFHTNNTAGIEVFSHNVSHMPGSLLFLTTVLGGSSAGARK